MAIYSGFTHIKWWFSIAMLVYQRVREVDLLSYFAGKLSVEKPTRLSRAVRATSFMSHRVGNVKSSLDPALCPVHWTLPRQWLVCWSLSFFSSKVLKAFETKLLLTWPICFFKYMDQNGWFRSISCGPICPDIPPKTATGGFPISPSHAISFRTSPRGVDTSSQLAAAKLRIKTWGLGYPAVFGDARCLLQEFWVV